MTETRRGQHGTAGASVFVIAFSIAAIVLLALLIPLVWALLAAIGIALGAWRLVVDIRGNKAM